MHTGIKMLSDEPFVSLLYFRISILRQAQALFKTVADLDVVFCKASSSVVAQKWKDSRVSFSGEIEKLIKKIKVLLWIC